MIIKFKRGAAHLGYAYRAGHSARSLPNKDCKFLIEAGIAEDVTPKPKTEKKEEKKQEKSDKPRRARVETAVINKRRK